MTKPLNAMFVLITLAGALTLSACSVLPLTSSSTQRALLVGNYYYKNISSHTLEGVQNDVPDMASLLSTRGYTVTSLLDSDASDYTVSSYANFVSKAKAMAASCSEFDRCIIYISGHGYLDSSQTAWVIFSDAPASLDGSEGMMSPAMLKAVLQPFKDKHALVCVILDTCYSGSFANSGSYADVDPANYASVKTQYLVQETNGSPLAAAFSVWLSPDTDSSNNSVWILAAARPQEVSWSSGGTHSNGVFTYYFTLLAGNSTADQNNDKTISVYEAYRWTRDSIKNGWDKQSDILSDTSDTEFLPTLSGNPYDFPLFTR